MAFSCERCGLCCKSENNSQFLGVRLFDFEAERIRKLALEKKISARIVPSLTIADKKSRRELAIMYKFEHTECPFYSESGCRIYDERPLLCRAFPIITSGRYSDGEIARSGMCQGIKNRGEFPNDVKEVIKEFGESYLYCVLFEETLHKIRKNVDEFIKKKEIIPEQEKGIYAAEGISKKFDLIDENNFFHELKTLENTRKMLETE
jgi:Fe-S-cluster containining protein